MGRKPIFDKAMTAAERQRRHREKKYSAAMKAQSEMSTDEWLASLRFDPGDLVGFDPSDLVGFDPEDFTEMKEEIS